MRTAPPPSAAPPTGSAHRSSSALHESPRAGTGCVQSPRPLCPGRLPTREHDFRLEGPSPSPLRHLHPLCSVLPPLGPVTTAPHHSSRTPRWVLSAGEQGAGAPRPPEPRRACSAPCGYGFNHRRDIHPVCRAGSASSLLSTSRDLEPQEAQVPASFPNTQDSHSLATPH